MRYNAAPSWLTRRGNPYQLLSTDARNGLVGLWLPNIGWGGPTLWDVSGYNNDGSYTNGAEPRLSQVGQVAYIGGSNQKILIPDSSSLSLASTLTLSILVRFDNLASSRCLIRKGSSGGTDITWLWYYIGGDGISFHTESDTKANWTPSTGVWYNITVRVNAGSTNHFIDGKKLTNSATNSNTWSNDSDPWNVGEWSSYDMIGAVAALAAWSTAKSDSFAWRLARGFWSAMFRNPDHDINLRAFVAGTTDISLTWTDNSESEDGFELQRREDGGAWAIVTDAIAADAESYTDSGLTTGHTYGYRIRALSAALGNSEWSNIASETV